MIRKTIKVLLTPQDRKRLEQIVYSPTTTKYDKLKASVLLFTDTGEQGQKKSSKDVALELDISKRCVCRIRQTYAKNKSIQDVFRQQESTKTDKEVSVECLFNVKKRGKQKRYSEKSDCQIEGIELEHVKYRVSLTAEERIILEDIIKSGKHSNRKLNRAKILLLADEGSRGPAMHDNDIANKLEVSISTICRVRRLLLSVETFEEVLSFNHEAAGRLPKIDGDVEAALVAIVCSSPPEGRCNWTLRLLRDQLVKLGHVDSISHVAIGNALKKMNLSLGRKKNG